MKTREWVLEKIVESVEYAKAHGLYISANAEDASRADPDFMITFAKTAKEAGADRFRYCDTLGMLEPRRTYDDIKRIIEEAKIDVEMHTHNDFGMATANAMAGRPGRGEVRLAPPCWASASAPATRPLEEIAMAAKHILKMDTDFDTTPVPRGLRVRGQGGRQGRSRPGSPSSVRTASPTRPASTPTGSSSTSPTTSRTPRRRWA